MNDLGPQGCALRRGWSWRPGGTGLAEVVASNAKRLRHRNGWTQGEVCRRVGGLLDREVSQAQLSAWEVHRQAIPLDLVALFAAVFDVALVELLRLPLDGTFPVELYPQNTPTVQRATDEELAAEVLRRLTACGGGGSS